MIWRKPAQVGTQVPLPGVRFGYLQEEDVPKVAPTELHLEADVEKRDAVREAFKVSSIV